MVFVNDTATTEIYTLSLHDALPIELGLRAGGELAGQDDGVAVDLAHRGGRGQRSGVVGAGHLQVGGQREVRPDRKSTRLNSSHANISYAVFCLNKNKSQATDH